MRDYSKIDFQSLTEAQLRGVIYDAAAAQVTGHDREASAVEDQAMVELNRRAQLLRENTPDLEQLEAYMKGRVEDEEARKRQRILDEDRKAELALLADLERQSHHSEDNDQDEDQGYHH